METPWQSAIILKIIQFLLVLMWAGSASAQTSAPSPAPTIEGASFAGDPQHLFGPWGDITALSGDGRTLTTTLPPDAAFDMDLTVEVELTYRPKGAAWYPPASFSAMSHAAGAIQMTYQSNSVTDGVRSVTLTAMQDRLKSLDEPRAFRFRFDPGPSGEIVWEIRPFEDHPKSKGHDGDK